MDKGAIKKYAVWARRELLERVSQRAHMYGITENGMVERGADSVNGRLLSSAEKVQRDALVDMVQRRGYEAAMEEAAYTWFNRFCALRFMEVNGYLPSMVRVFTDETGAFKPQILTEALHLDLEGLDQQRVIAFKEASQEEELYKYLILTQCGALNGVLPRLFQRLEDCMELLFPDHLLREGSVLEQLVTTIPEEDWKDAVQIIGWLYQYYNTEPKDQVFAALKKNIKVSRENIPAATQLFTPDWIVRYMVENSLGRLWLEGHPSDALKADWKYYLEEAAQEPETEARLAELRAEYARMGPEDLRVIDPCMGSGHILAYLFDVLMQIYASCGYSTREAVRNIITQNLYGLDIDERAAQLAYFSVMMKARQYDANFLSRGLQPQVYATRGDAEGPEFGSLLLVEDPGPRPEQQDLFGGSEDAWNYRRLLAGKYDVVCTNPPYMAVSNAGGKLQEYVKKNFPDSKGDLFACFIERCGRLTRENGYQAMITQHAWMFLSSFEKLRAKLQAVDTVNMAHLGPRAFEEIGGEVVQTTSFVMRRSHVGGYKGTYCRLIEPNTQRGKEEMFLAGENRYVAQQDNFSKIPGAPVAYWVSEQALMAFENGKCISDFAKPKAGLATGNNELFERYWFEVAWNRIGFNYNSVEETADGKYKWFPCNSGGEFRKWSFNNEIVVDWYNDGQAVKSLKNASGRLAARPQNTQFYFKKGLTWNKLSSSRFAVKYKESGFIFDDTSRSLFLRNQQELLYLLGFLCSIVTFNYLEALNPTMSFTNGDIERIPYLFDSMYKELVDGTVQKNLEISRNDWNAFETSWDFIKHPLI